MKFAHEEKGCRGLGGFDGVTHWSLTDQFGNTCTVTAANPWGDLALQELIHHTMAGSQPPRAAGDFANSRMDQIRLPAIVDSDDESYDSWDFRSEVSFSDDSDHSRDSLDSLIDELDRSAPTMTVVVRNQVYIASHSDELYRQVAWRTGNMHFFLRFSTQVLSQAHIPLIQYGLHPNCNVHLTESQLLGGNPFEIVPSRGLKEWKPLFPLTARRNRYRLRMMLRSRIARMTMTRISFLAMNLRLHLLDRPDRLLMEALQPGVMRATSVLNDRSILDHVNEMIDEYNDGPYWESQQTMMEWDPDDEEDVVTRPQASCMDEIDADYTFEVDFFGKKRSVNILLWFESLGCLMGQLARATDMGSVVDAFGACIRSLTGRAVSVVIIGKLLDFLGVQPGVVVNDDFPDVPHDEYAELYERLLDLGGLGPEQQSGENPFAKIRSLFNTADELKDSPFVRKVTLMFYYLVANGMLDSVGITMEWCQFSECAQAYYKEKYKPSFGMLYVLADGLTFFLEKMYLVYASGDPHALWHSESRYSNFADRVAAVRTKALGLCNPTAFGLNYHAYVKEIDDLLADGYKIVKFIHRAERPKMQSLLYELEKLKADDVVAKAASAGRRMPMGINIFGKSGVLKSTVEKIMGVHYGRVRKLPLGEEFHYTIVPTAEYYSGFTSKVWWITIDDAAAIRPGVIADLDPTIRDFLQIFNNVAWAPPQAELELKGKTPCYAELATATTNTAHLNAKHYFSNDVAIRRRCRIHVEVKIKPEYVLEGTSMADKSKIPPLSEGEYPDVWEFTVFRIGEQESSDGSSHAIFVKAFETDSIYAFLNFFTQEILDHACEQDAQQDTAAKIVAMKVCTRCCLPRCDCGIRPQAIEINEAMQTVVHTMMILFLARVIYLSYTIVPRLQRSATQFIDNVVEVSKTPQVRAVAEDLASAAANKVAGEVRAYGKNIKKEILESLRKTRSEYLKPIGKLLGAVAIMAGGYAYYRYTRPREQAEEFVAMKPKAEPVETENVWFKQTFVPCELDRGIPPPVSQRTQLLDNIKRNLVNISVRRQKEPKVIGRTDGNALCVGGNLYVTNSHVIGEYPEVYVTMIEQEVDDGVSPNVTVRITKGDVWHVPNEDIAFFMCRQLPARKNIVSYFPKKSANYGICDGVVVTRDKEGKIVERKAKAATSREGSPNGDFKSTFYWKTKVDKATQVGDCGSPYFLDHPTGPMLAAIHFAGSPTYSYGVMMSQEMCKEAEKYFDEPIVSQGTVDLSDVDGQIIQLEPLHQKSVFRFIQNGQARVYGSLPGFRARHRSKVTKTYLYDRITQSGYPDRYGAPVAHGWRIWRNAAIPIITQENILDQSAFKECAQAYLDDILEGLDPRWLEEFRMLDDVSVVNGYPGVRFVDGMDKNTSMGFPWRKKKKHFLTEVSPPQEPYSVQMEFDDSFMKRVQKIEEKHLAGERANPIFVAHMKDEPRKWKKIAEFMTRQMAGCPSDYVFHVRKYLLTFIRIFQSNPILFEGAPGTNHNSQEWDKIFHFLTEFGLDQIVAGDFAGYDKSMQACAIIAAYWVIYKIAQRAGWPEERARVILCIGHDMAHAFMDFNGDLVQFLGSNPSGHPLTVIINCIVNSLYMRFVWKLKGNELKTFKLYIHLMTYGDDNIMGISRTMSHIFNHTAIQVSLATIGVEYTMAEKDQESVPLISIFQSTFLKRGWRFDKDIGMIVAPLEEESIGRSLTKCIPSKTECMQAHMCSVIHNAVREYFLYGRERFEERRSFFAKLLVEEDLEDYMQCPLPTYAELLATYHRRSEGYSCACQAQSDRYLNDPYHQALEDKCTGQNYMVLKPKCSPESQLLRDRSRAEVASVGVRVTCQGDPRNLSLETCPAGTQARTCGVTNGLISTADELPTKQQEPQEAPIPQAGEVTDTENTTAQTTSAENITFVDGSLATPYETPGQVSNVDQLVDKDLLASLGGFLSRPVVIKSFVWTESTPLTPAVFFPWYEFFNNTFIKDKLKNFSRLRCKLKLKFVTNASPFYYGSLRACYFPLDDSTGARSVYTNAYDLVRFSQTPGVYIEPQTMSSVEMTLPFVWVADWLDTALAAQFKCMGAMNIVEYATLDSANGVAGAGVSVKVYAWAEDVEIAGPTKGLLLQSEEYEEKDGVISRPATAIASVARRAAAIPMFQPYARAAEIGAGAVASIAQLFGYSNPPLIDDSMPVSVKSFHAMANTTTRVPQDVLAVDPKNEIVISSSVNGYTGEDELSLKYLTQKESYLDASSWTSAKAADTALWTATVNPGLIRKDGTDRHYTPLAYFGELYRFWRGGLKFKFRFIKTKYHRGRVSITWDPGFNIQSDAATETTNFTRIVDLEFEDEVEVIVPYKGVTPYLLYTAAESLTNSTSPSVTLDKEYDNGLIVVRVLNVLTGPAASPQVTMLTYISAANDFEYAVPGELPDTYVVSQSQEVLEENKELGIKAQVTTGERMASVRQLLHRQSFWSTQALGAMWNNSDARFTTGWRWTHNYLPKVPIPYAESTRGCNWKTGTPPLPFQFAKNHPINWVINCFAGYKGSTNMSFNCNRSGFTNGNASDIAEMSAGRFSKNYIVRSAKQNRNGATDFTSTGSPSSISRSACIEADGTSTAARLSGRTGMSLTNQRTQAALQVHVPQYTTHRLLIGYAPLRNKNFVTGSGYIEDNVDFATSWYQTTDWNATTWPTVDIYYSAGTDFNPVFFVCAPSISVVTAPAAENAALPV